MPNPIKLSIILSILKKHGFTKTSQKGSHAKYKNKTNTVIVKNTKKEIPYGTFTSIAMQSGIDKEDFYI